MVNRLVVGLALGALLLTQPLSVALSATETPAATHVLFDVPHLANVDKGTTLTYNFERQVSEPKLLGAPFKDQIHIDIANVGQDSTRDVVVRVFSGETARPPQAISGMTGNPLLVVFLDRSVNNLALLAGGSRPFLKNKIKMSFSSSAKVEPVEIDYKGAAVKGNRVTVTPFVGDPNALKMMGYDGARFEIVVSDAVPGQFVSLVSHYESPQKGSPELDERTVLDGVGSIK